VILATPGVLSIEYPAAPLATGAAPIPPDHAIHPRSPLGGRGNGTKVFGALTVARSRFNAWLI
jgi:hypothetical protein